VEVSAVPGKEFNTYSIRDNGAGLDVANAKGLFEPFRRFHSATDFSGTGVGLAIAKRVIERQGGKICAESELGKGATFLFTLPARPPEELRKP